MASRPEDVKNNESSNVYIMASVVLEKYEIY